MATEVFRDERETQRSAIRASAGFGEEGDLRVARYSENVDLARVHPNEVYHSACLVLSGGMTRVDRPMPTIRRGAITVEPTWFEGTFTNEGPTDWIMVFLRADRLAEMAGDLSSAGRSAELQRVQGIPDPGFAALMRMCATSTLGGHAVTRLELDGWAQVLGAHLLRNHASGQDTGSRATELNGRALSILLDVIEAEIDSDLSLVSLARILDMSTTRLSSGFRKSTGRSLHQYVLDRRVERAQVLIAETTDSLADIAFAVGFSSQSHLTSIFRTRLGMTPGQYREAVRS